MKVCKFGGSSLADAGQISMVMDIVLADPARRNIWGWTFGNAVE